MELKYGGSCIYVEGADDGRCNDGVREMHGIHFQFCSANWRRGFDACHMKDEVWGQTLTLIINYSKVQVRFIGRLRRDK